MDRGDDDTWILVSDVDDTLVGDDEPLRRFVRRTAPRTSLIVALNSSRPIASVQRTLDELPIDFQPNAIIGAMGTEVLIGNRMDAAWTARFSGWQRGPIDRIMRKRGHRPHDDEFQTPRKASFAVPAEAQADVVADIEALDMPCRIVRSGESDFDVLPAGADKGEATLHLAETLGIAIERMIVAGDSANDLGMFAIARKGIVVGNARDELRDAVDRDRVYFAAAARAAGVLEGLEHYGALPPDGATSPSVRHHETHAASQSAATSTSNINSNS